MGKINSLQFCSLFIIIILQSFFGLEGLNFINTSYNNSYISIIISFILGILLIYLFIYIFSFKKNLSINEKIGILFNKKIGFIIKLILIICFINISITIFYNLNSFINNYFLNETPFLLIGLLFLVIIIYINTKGFEVISRVSLILLILSFLSSLIGFISTSNCINLNNLLPIYNNNFKDIYIGSLDIIINSIIPIFLLLIIPKKKIVDSYKINKYIFISYIITFIIVLITVIYIIGVLGINLTIFYKYPEYMLYKRINLFDFINRIENILIIKYIFGYFITISLITHYISKTITKKNNNYLYIIITLLPLFISLLIFKNEVIFKNYINYIIPYTRIIILFIFILIGFKIFLYNKNNNNS